MKKLSKLFGMTMAGLLMAGMTACKDDNEYNEPEGGNSPIESTGMQLYSVGNINFSYDNKGRCIGFNKPHINYNQINWEKGEIMDSDAEGDGAIKFKVNGNGYFSEMWQDWDYIDDYDDYYKGSGKMTFSYDKQGHLSKIYVTMKESGTEEGEKFNWSGTSEVSMTWKNGNLVRTHFKVTEIEDGEKDVYEEEETVEYGQDENKFGQYCYSLVDNCLGFDYEDFALVGLFGKGTAQFPVEVTVKESDYDYPQTFSVDITTDEEGLISRELTSNGTYYYNYQTPSTSEKIIRKAVKSRPGSMFRFNKRK